MCGQASARATRRTDLRDSDARALARPRSIERQLEVQPRPDVKRLADAFVERLRAAGVSHAFGISGGAIAVFMDAMRRGEIQVVHCRHESGAAFAATEYSLATGRPAVVFTTTGPGLTNAVTGICAAQSEGARIVLVSGATAAERATSFPFQETIGSLSALSSWAGNARATDFVLCDGASVRAAARSVDSFAASAAGGVVRVLFPTSAQSTASDLGPASVGPGSRTRLMAVRPLDDRLIARCAGALAKGTVVVWVGFGARGSGAVLRRLVEQNGWHVMSTPRGKGVFPESHSRYLGVTGLGGHDDATRFLREHRPDCTLVLGTRLAEFTSFWSADYVPRREFIHVDVDSSVFGRAYPDAATFGVQASVDAFLHALETALPKTRGVVVPTRASKRPPEVSTSSAAGIHPAAAMAAIQRVVVERTDAIVMTEAGNTFAWGSRALHFDSPRYRVSTSFGAMGQATAGVVGAAMAHGKAVAIVGDGAMLMNHEVSTAVQYGASAVWVVFNDAKFGMVEHGMRAVGMEPMETAIPPVDFAQIARAVGAVGIRVDEERELEAALAQAIAECRPVVVDVRIDGSVPPPFGSRNASLRAQGIEVER